LGCAEARRVGGPRSWCGAGGPRGPRRTAAASPADRLWTDRGRHLCIG